MYEVAMSSRGGATENNETDLSGSMSSIDGLGGSQQYTDPIRHVYLIMKFAIAGFLTLLLLGGYKLVFAEHQPDRYAEIIEFEAPRKRADSVKAGSRADGFKADIKREFVSVPTIDPTVTASVNGAIEIARSQPGQESRPSYRDTHYVVQPGDSLNKIAKANKIQLATLISINGIDNPALIRPGMKLLLVK